MRLGIIGMGCIGTANYEGFATLEHDVSYHDPKLNTELKSVLDTQANFICVPTPSLQNGACDTQIVQSVLSELVEHNYRGIAVIRSTVEPGFTKKMQNQFPNMEICFSPEFLRERCAKEDFIYDQKLLVVGTDSVNVAETVRLAHGSLPKNFVQMSANEAELLKYFNNVYAALRITFANVFYDICHEFEADYSKIKQAYLLTDKSTGMYLDANPKLRGFAGMCLPKDTKAMAALLKDKGLPFGLFDAILNDNENFDKTVIGDMRY